MTTVTTLVVSATNVVARLVWDPVANAPRPPLCAALFAVLGAFSVTVPMMNVRIMRMRVRQFLVPMRMGVRLA